MTARITKPPGYFPRGSLRGFTSYPPPQYSGLSAGSVPLRVGPLSAFGQAVSSLVIAITFPVVQGVMGQNIPYLVQGTLSQAGAAVSVHLGAAAPVAATVVGTTWSVSITPLVAGPLTLTATASQGGAVVPTSVAVNVVASIAHWIDSQQPASYTAVGTTLNSVRNLAPGATALATKVGNPLLLTDPRNALPSFFLDGSSYLSGNDAVARALPTGTDKAFTAYIVATAADSQINGEFLAFADGVQAGNTFEFLESAGVLYHEKLGQPAGPVAAFSRPMLAGTHVYAFRSSADGLSVGVSIDGDAETVATHVSVGPLAPTNVGFGIMLRNVVTFPFGGYQNIQLLCAGRKPDIEHAAIIQGLLNQVLHPTLFVAVGDSITTAELATNGGFVQLLASYCYAHGVHVSPEGPLFAGQTQPTRHSASSGNTCPQMQTRVDTPASGLGAGTPFQRARLGLLFAGTNPTGGTAANTATAYRTLLLDMATKMYGSQPTARIAVTTITPIQGADAFIDAYNALLPAIWDEHDGLHPANPVIRWDAHACFGSYANGAANGWYVDITHPTNAGYVQLANDPVNGLIQAVFPFLQSLPLIP